MIFVKAVECKVCLSYFILLCRSLTEVGNCVYYLSLWQAKAKAFKNTKLSRCPPSHRLKVNWAVSTDCCQSYRSSWNLPGLKLWTNLFTTCDYVFIEGNCHFSPWARINIHLEELDVRWWKERESYKSFCFARANYLRRFFSQFNYVALWNFYLFLLMMFRFLCCTL